jgi:hypothetical protein
MSAPGMLDSVLYHVGYSETAFALYVLLAVAIGCTHTRVMQMQGWAPFVRVAAVLAMVATFVADTMVRQYYLTWEYGATTYTDDGHPVYPELSPFALAAAFLAAALCALIAIAYIRSYMSEQRRWRGVVLLGGATGVLAALGLTEYTQSILMPFGSTIKFILQDVWMYSRDIAAVLAVLFILGFIWAERLSYGERMFHEGANRVYDEITPLTETTPPQTAEAVEVAEVPTSQWQPQSSTS